MTPAERLLQEVDARSRALFERLARGDDAPPSMCLRLEGLREAAALLGVPREALQEQAERIHRDVFGTGIGDVVGEDWREAYPFPEIPVFMQRAPVEPTTAD